MMEKLSFQRSLCAPDALLVRGRCRDEFRSYIHHLFLLVQNKLSEGCLIEAQQILRELKSNLASTSTINPTVTRVVLSQLMQAELQFCCLELYVKRKSKQKLKLQRQKLAEKLRGLGEEERRYIVHKANCLVLFDTEFELFETQRDHPDQQATLRYRQGKFEEAATILESSLKHQLVPNFEMMRRVFIGKALLEASDLSGFAWLGYVIQSPSQCGVEKYEARSLFVAGYKVLIVGGGKNPQLSLLQLDQILEDCYLFFENLKEEGSRIRLPPLPSLQTSLSFSIQERIQDIESTLVSACFPRASMQELNLRIELAELLHQKQQFNRCLEQTQKSKTLASQLDIYYWTRRVRISRLSALIYMGLGYFESVVELLNEVIEIVPDQEERMRYGRWRGEALRKMTESATEAGKSEWTLSILNERNLSVKSVLSKSSRVSSNMFDSSNKKIESLLDPKNTSFGASKDSMRIRKPLLSQHFHRHHHRPKVSNSIQDIADDNCCLLF